MLRLATLNQYQPGLSSDDLSDVGQLVDGGKGGSKANVWEALRGWGQRLYRKADIVFLTEVRHAPHVRFLAQPDISGLQYYAMLQEPFYTDVAILSRYPLSDVRPIRIDRHNILAAKVMIESISHLLIAVHWYTGSMTYQSRREAAQRMLELIRETNSPAFVAGDLNVSSGYGPGGSLGSSVPEYLMLASELWDVYQLILPQPPYCSDQRIDYIFFKGDYEPTEFNACLNAAPSDHPFVIASLKQKGVTSSRVKTHAPITAVSPATDEILVTGVADESLENGRLFYADWTPNSGWRGWYRLDSRWTPESAHGLPESFVGSGVEADRIYLFWIGSDKWVMHAWRLPDGYWFWWPVGNSNVPALNGVPGGAVHAISCQPGMLHVFYTNPDGHILVARRDTPAGGTWPEHRGLLGGVTSPGGHVTAVSRRPGQLDVFHVGLDGRVYTAAWNLQDGWRGWWVIGDVLARPGTYIGVVSRSLDHLDIFVSDVEGRTMSAAWEPGLGWRGWWHIQGGRTGSSGYVTAVSRSMDKLDIFTTGLDWRVYTAAWEPSNGWGGWWPINDAISQSPVWPVSRSSDKLDIFFVTPEGTIQTAAWEPGTTWSRPAAIKEGWNQP
jgi:endonuclease/exonuclease/phosphatase family metal-dependent hydrolase